MARSLNVSPPTTGVGFTWSVVVPSPSCPRSFSPQQYAAPAVDKAQEISAALETKTRWNVTLVPAETGVGVRIGVSPVCGWPATMYPQQYAAPVVETAHVCSAAITEAMAGGVVSVGGVCW